MKVKESKIMKESDETKNSDVVEFSNGIRSLAADAREKSANATFGAKDTLLKAADQLDKIAEEVYQVTKIVSQPSIPDPSKPSTSELPPKSGKVAEDISNSPDKITSDDISWGGDSGRTQQQAQSLVNDYNSGKPEAVKAVEQEKTVIDKKYGSINKSPYPNQNRTEVESVLESLNKAIGSYKPVTESWRTSKSEAKFTEMPGRYYDDENDYYDDDDDDYYGRGEKTKIKGLYVVDSSYLKGTSATNLEIFASYNQMKDVLSNEGDSDDLGPKTSVQWAIEYQGNTFSIYDYRGNFNAIKNPDNEVEWHVGSAGKVSDRGLRDLNSAISRAISSSGISSSRYSPKKKSSSYYDDDEDYYR